MPEGLRSVLRAQRLSSVLPLWLIEEEKEMEDVKEKGIFIAFLVFDSRFSGLDSIRVLVVWLWFSFFFSEMTCGGWGRKEVPAIQVQEEVVM